MVFFAQIINSTMEFLYLLTKPRTNETTNIYLFVYETPTKEVNQQIRYIYSMHALRGLGIN